ncbi:MAG TPA: DUF3313 family protein [Rhizomicrobium sp.]|nr:DUF3313 family protein [Rhizomicrobium sp.]
MTMRALRLNGAILLAAIALCGSAAAQQQAPQSIAGGLERVQGSKVALAYLRPGTDWTKYRTILLKTLAVPANARNAAPPGAVTEFGESYMLNDSDVAQLQSAFAQSMHNVLGNAGYTFVTTPQSDTLIVAPEIKQIYLNAPTESSRLTNSNPGMTLSQGGGSITMGAVLADGTTRVVLGEVLDRKYGSNVWGVNNSASNLGDARQAFDGWASDLKNKLQSE